MAEQLSLFDASDAPQFIDEQQLEFARQLRPRVDGWIVDGKRPIGAYEMSCLRTLRQYELDQRRELDGCCSTEGPRADGSCRHRCGKCALVEAAECIIWKAENDGKE